MTLVDDSAVLNLGLSTHFTRSGEGEVLPRLTESEAHSALGEQNLEICIFKRLPRDLPAGQVAKTPCSQHRGPTPGQGTRFCMMKLRPEAARKINK